MLQHGRFRRPSDSAIAESRQTPTLPLLEECSVPVIAVAGDGTVVFANTAFADVLGCSRDAVTSMSFEDISSAMTTEETLFAVARLRADIIGSLLPLEGTTFFAKISKSAILDGADSVAIATFEELMERASG
jgi:PAS domain S-box-containing protein